MTDFLSELAEILDRASDIDALGALIGALGAPSPAAKLANTAIGLDANVFLRIAADKDAELIIDYLTALHSAPLVLPGQAIQEFWNNQHEVATTVSKPLRSSFNSFRQVAEKIAQEVGTLPAQLDELIKQFESEHAYVYDPATLAKTGKLLEALKAKAIVPFAKRSAFIDIAGHRKRTKTPPGFKDTGDGDFFVWVDFLYGLQTAKAGGMEFERAVIVTNDVKLDWSRGDAAHPILVAEAAAAIGVPFETWTLKKLVSAIREELKSDESPPAQESAEEEVTPQLPDEPSPDVFAPAT